MRAHRHISPLLGALAILLVLLSQQSPRTDVTASDHAGAIRSARAAENVRSIAKPGAALAVTLAPGTSPVALREAAGVHGISITSGVPELGVYRAALPPGADAAALISQFEALSGVTRVEAEPQLAWALHPDDPLYPRQQGYLDLVDAEQAWDYQPGNRTIVVAVLDSGIDVDHPDLDGQIWTNPTPGRTGCPGDLHGCNFVDPAEVSRSCPNQSSAAAPNGDVRPYLYHGTTIAGIIGARVDNEAGIAGIVRNATIMPVRVGDCLAPFPMPLARGIMYAVNNGARVINLSVGGNRCQSMPSYVLDAIDYAVRAGVVVVAAAGNDGQSCVGSPANHAGVIAVGASDGDRRPDFSQWGPEIAVVAPGVGVLGPVPLRNRPPPNDLYGPSDGTSFSVPFVSALAALLLAQNPLLTPAQVRELIQRGATPLPDGFTPHWAGAGRIDLLRSLQLVPGAFYGRVTFAGTPVGDGTLVSALVDGQPCGSATTYSAGGESWYELFVDSAVATPGCGDVNATVVLSVAGAAVTVLPWSQSSAFADLAAQ